MRGALLAVCLQFAAAPEGALRFALEDGRVWLSAHDVRVSSILEAWHRVSGLVTVHAERLGDARVTLEIIGAPESATLETVLRSVSGYVLVHRTGSGANQSTFDRLIIAPTSRVSAVDDRTRTENTPLHDGAPPHASPESTTLAPLLLDAMRHTRARSDADH